MTTRPLRVLHVIPAIAARYGGPSHAVTGMCRALQSAGVETLIATSDADGAGRLRIPLERIQLHNGVPTIVFRRHLHDGFKWTPRLGGWLSARVGEFDLVHIHAVFSYSSIAAGAACRLAGVPYIVRPLGTLDPWSIGRKKLQKQLLLRAGAGELLTGAAAIHYTSEGERDAAETALAPRGRGVVAALGIDDEVFVAGAGASATVPYVLTMSRLDEKKGIDVLIRAFARVAERGGIPPAWKLAVAGTGSNRYVGALRAMAAATRVSARVEFDGWLGGAAKLGRLTQAGLFALPSHQENFGVAAVEALAAGVPVLVTPGVNLAGAIAQAGAGWVCERSEIAVAEALETILNDPDERLRRGRAARVFAEQYRWGSAAERVIGVYARVLSDAAARREVA